MVIFSERVDTVKFLEEQLAKRFKTEIGVFYGTLEEFRQHARVKDFGTEGGRVRDLLATDAVSEGLNLHSHCHRLVHFYVPWSLIRPVFNLTLTRWSTCIRPDSRPGGALHARGSRRGGD